MPALETDLDALWNSFTESRDIAALGIIADWYEERGDEFGVFLRWCWVNGRLPKRRFDGLYEWFPKHFHYGNNSILMPKAITGILVNLGCNEYYYGSISLRRAYEFAYEGFIRLSADQQTEALAMELVK